MSKEIMYLAGWVPTVTGHLSFGSIGHTTHPSKSNRIRNKRKFCVIQNRDLLDVVLPFQENTAVGRFVRETFSNYVVGISGQFTFVATCAEQASGEELVGTVYLIPRRENRELLKKLKQQFGCNERDAEAFNEAHEAIEASCKSGNIFCADFKLLRNGKIFFTVCAGEDTTVAKLVANQFFYFFKDISHVHQHHDPKQDAITQLAVVSGSADNSWIKETQHSLYREVIRYKRFRSEGALFRASGVLAYAQSFECSHVRSNDEAHVFNNDELEKSLSVSRDELRHEDQKRLAQVETVRNWFFSLFGLMMSATFLVRLNPQKVEIDVSEHLINFTTTVAEKPFAIAALVAAFATSSSFISHRKDPAKISIVRTVFRWMQGFHIRWLFISNVILTGIFSFLFYWLLIKQIF